jgi:polyisoprenoid-binding protein YceI
MIKRKSLAAAALCAMTWRDASAANSSYAAATNASKFEFVGIQAGAEFKGTFRAYTATVDFDPDALDRARIDVQIQLGSVDTQDKDRDQTIRGPDILDSARFPTAHYVTRSIVKSGSGYTAIGALTLRGVTKDVPVSFQFIASGQSAKLVGTAQLKRLDFGAGQGDWKSTEWIADSVKISFALVLNPSTGLASGANHHAQAVS